MTEDIFFTINFAPHLSETEVFSTVFSIAAYAAIESTSGYTYRVKMMRPSEIMRFKALLLGWQREGLLHWSD